jgi:hypothetical protein
MTADTNDISDGFHTFGELYEHRHALFVALINACPYIPGWMSRQHHDGSAFDGHFIAGMDLPTGQIRYHIPNSWWDTYTASWCVVRERAPEWDGHTSQDVINRLIIWTKQD